MKRRPIPAFAPSAGEPMSEINTTPLIDVMLVLLIMFVITVPIATHKVAIDTPSGPTPATKPVVRMLDLDSAGRIYWDGVPTSEARLPALLAEMRASGPETILHFRADGETRYEVFDRVLATVKKAGVERLGLIGNERFARTNSG